MEKEFWGAVEKRMNETFELTEDHIKLLNNSYTSWKESSEFGAACIDSKRPYGNSDVIGDMHEILTGKVIDENELEDSGVSYDDFVDSVYEKYKKLHEETETALQIVLNTKSFDIGLYKRAAIIGKWIKVE